MNRLEISTPDFRRLVEQITDYAVEYLNSLDSRPVAPQVTGRETEALFGTALPEAGLGEAALTSLPEVIKHSRAQNGRFFGYVLGSGEPVGAAADLLVSVLNQNVTAWRSAPAAVAIEKTVVGWLASAIRCPGFSGSLTGGGSAANLMGLAMARESKAPANQAGALPGGTVYASEEAHMSISKGIALLGIGRDSLRLIPTDSSFQMIPAELERSITTDRDAGKTPIAVVATAGTVNTGAIDPIRAIAEIAHANQAWLHIDGAYGVLAAMTVRDRFERLELADSISLDPHKWLYQPLDCGCLLFRGDNAARKAFSDSGEYARALSADPIEGFAFFDESLELSRRFRALRLWLSLRYHGFAAFRESIRYNLDLAEHLADAIRAEPRLELVAPVSLSAVCFRYCGAGEASDPDLNTANLAILKRLVARGRVYLSSTSLRGKFCLRACIVNHRTKDSDVGSIVAEVLASAAEAC